MNYLITGGAGFIGSHLSEYLLKDNRVCVIDNLSTGKKENIDHLLYNENFSFIEADISNFKIKGKFDFIIHLAATVGVDLVLNNPINTIDNNILGTKNILETAKNLNARIIITSTSEVYGKSEIIPFNEKDNLLLGSTNKIRWCYSASKIIDEFLAFSYYQQYNVPITIVRFFNTIGKRQSDKYGMVVPKFINQALKNKDITIYGDGLQTRCFCDVNDVIKAIKLLCNSNKSIGEIFNIGNIEEISILNLAKKIKHITNSKSKIKFTKDKNTFEDMNRRLPDINKIKNIINWEPKIKLDESLNEIIRSKI